MTERKSEELRFWGLWNSLIRKFMKHGNGFPVLFKTRVEARDYARPLKLRRVSVQRMSVTFRRSNV